MKQTITQLAAMLSLALSPTPRRISTSAAAESSPGEAFAAAPPEGGAPLRVGSHVEPLHPNHSNNTGGAMQQTITQLAAMLALALLIALLLSMTACGPSDQSDPDMETKGRAADGEMADDTLAAFPDLDEIQELRAADIEMADGTLAAFPDLDEDTAKVPLPGDMENHPLSRYFNGDGIEALEYIGRFSFVCNPEQVYIKARCDKAVARGIRIGQQAGIRLTRADLVNPEYWKMVNVVYRMQFDEMRECRRAFNGPRLTASLECTKARNERVALLLDELSID